MNIVILGATGHVGRELVRILTNTGHHVTAITRHAQDIPGATIAEADVLDTPRLRDVLATGRRAFLLNPPADPSGNTDRDERATAEAIVRALDGSGLERVVAQSTWGTRPGHGYGDLSVLHHFEALLANQPIPAVIMRATYLMSNWDAPAKAALKTGTLQTMLPEDLVLPMVSPVDLAKVAANLLIGEFAHDPVHVEGPARYTPRDVAQAIASASGRPVQCRTIPRARWQDVYRQLGFSQSAATSYAQMTRAVVDGEIEIPAHTVKGSVTLVDHFS